MSLPPDFLDELRARVPVSREVGRAVRLARAGRGELKGLCPFHREKTPSFTVNDDKGFYHCFGCGAHGDVITFLREHDGLDFMAAVERLAADAGLAVPRPDPKAREAEAHRTSLAELLEAAARAFQAALAGAEGRAARDYLERRGVEPGAVARFRLGYAPAEPRRLLDGLAGADADSLVQAGLLRPGQDGRPPYPLFRDRLVFPVADGRGRIVGFGGRLLSGDGPKYLNSPDGPLFHKGRLLYNLDGARGAARGGQTVLVVEGYMDVIALAEAGFEAAVAPLGTALTEDQVALLWRLSPEPVLCFDGDEAGRRAAARAIDRILPHLKPDHSVKFAFLPPGEDPDSLVRAGGRAALVRVLDAARPLVDAVWERETAARRLDGPEARAGLSAALDRLAEGIADRDVRSFYRTAFRRRIGDAFFARPKRAGAGPGGPASRPGAGPAAGQAGPRPHRAPGGPVEAQRRLGRLMVALMIRHPDLFEAHGESVASLELADRDLDRLRGAVVGLLADTAGLDSPALCRHLDETGFGETWQRLFGADWAMDEALGTASDYARAEARWRELERQWQRRRILADLDQARRLFVEEPSARNQARLLALQQELAIEAAETIHAAEPDD